MKEMKSENWLLFFIIAMIFVMCFLSYRSPNKLSAKTEEVTMQITMQEEIAHEKAQEPVQESARFSERLQREIYPWISRRQSLGCFLHRRSESMKRE